MVWDLFDVSRQERDIAENIEYILGGGDEERLALTYLDAIDVGFAP